MGVKASNNISSESTHQIHSLKFMYSCILLGRVSTKVVQVIWCISNFHQHFVSQKWLVIEQN